MNTALVRSPMSFDHKKVNAFLGAKEIHNNFPETNTICIANSHSGGKDEDVLLYSLYLKITGGYKIFIADRRFRYSLLYSVLGFFATTLLEPYSK